MQGYNNNNEGKLHRKNTNGNVQSMATRKKGRKKQW
jgi:hypothetical protein